MVRTRLLLVLAVVGLAACSNATGPCGPAAITIEVSVSADAMEPSEIAACRDQDVTFEIDSQTDGELHLHGYDVEAELTSGERVGVEFTADAAGQFIIELHAAGEEIEIGVLTVQEP